MSVSDRIHALRSSIPGCQTVAFGDAATRLILKAAHDTDLPREVLDRYCAEAVGCFALSRKLVADAANVEESVVLTADNMRIYVQDTNRSDFLFLICDLACDADLAVEKGTQVLSELAGTE